MTKGRLTIRIIAGGYLAYVGFGLAEKPENYLVDLLFGALFMAVGGTWCFLALRRYIRRDYEELWEEPKDEGKEEKDIDRKGNE